MAFGKKKDNEGLEVLNEMKEPFSFAGFFEEHIVERAKKIKKFLEEKGILFFLLSPFQQRNRLIVQLTIIAFGLFLGIIPRSMHLVEEAKIRNAASEMAALIDKNTQITAGSITVRPLASSQYEKQHLLAFLIASSSGDSVPSTAERYTVELSPARGVTDAEHVTYAYDVLPISEEQRLLLVYTDNREQNDNTGIYNLSVEVTSDEISEELKSPMEIVLSNTQKTGELFGEDGIDLACLTELVLNDPNTPIEKARDELTKSLDDYELETERIAGLPLDLTVSPSPEELHDFVKANFLYGKLSDTSTTKDIAGMEEAAPEEGQTLEYPAAIACEGVTYDQAYFDQKANPSADMTETGGPSVTDTDAETPADTESIETGNEQAALSSEEVTISRELASLQTKVDDVLHALVNLNSVCQTKFQTLKGYELMLNQTVSVKDFPVVQKVKGL